MRKLAILWVTGLLAAALFWTGSANGPRIVTAGTQVRPNLSAEPASRPPAPAAEDASSYNYFHLMATEPRPPAPRSLRR